MTWLFEAEEGCLTSTDFFSSEVAIRRGDDGSWRVKGIREFYSGSIHDETSGVKEVDPGWIRSVGNGWKQRTTGNILASISDNRNQQV